MGKTRRSSIAGGVLEDSRPPEVEELELLLDDEDELLDDEELLEELELLLDDEELELLLVDELLDDDELELLLEDEVPLPLQVGTTKLPS